MLPLLLLLLTSSLATTAAHQFPCCYCPAVPHVALLTDTLLGATSNLLRHYTLDCLLSLVCSNVAASCCCLSLLPTVIAVLQCCCRLLLPLTVASHYCLLPPIAMLQCCCLSLLPLHLGTPCRLCYAGAANACSVLGARLCTAEEVYRGAAAGQSCNTDTTGGHMYSISSLSNSELRNICV